MMIRFWFILGLLGLGGGLGGCDDGPAPKPPERKIKLGFVVKQPDEPWFQMEWKFAEEAAAKNGFELVRIGAPDHRAALEAMKTLSTNGARGLVLCAPDVNKGPEIVRSAAELNLKLLTVDDRLLDSSGVYMTQVRYMGIAARDVGQMVAVALLDEMKRRGWKSDETRLIVMTRDSLDTIRQRTDSARQTLRDSGFADERVLAIGVEELTLESAQRSISPHLPRQAGVKRWLVCGGNDSVVLGVVRALEAQKVDAADIIAVGINGTDAIQEFTRPGPSGFFASVLLSARTHGYKSAELLYRWVKDGSEPPEQILTPGILINRQNFQAVLKEQGITR